MSLSPRGHVKADDYDASSQGGQRVYRICLGETEQCVSENELITTCKYVG